MGSRVPSFECVALPARVRSGHRCSSYPPVRMEARGPPRLRTYGHCTFDFLVRLAGPRRLLTDRYRFESWPSLAQVGLNSLQRTSQPLDLGRGLRYVEPPRARCRLASPWMGRSHHDGPSGRVPAAIGDRRPVTESRPISAGTCTNRRFRRVRRSLAHKPPLGR